MIAAYTKRIRSAVARLIPLTALTLGLASCTLHKTCCGEYRLQPPPAAECAGPRPCVMVKYCPWITDYAPDCGPYEDKRDVAPVPKEYLNPLQVETEKYRFQIGDVLEVSLLTREDNSVSSVIIAPDGNIYYSFLDAISAVNRTAEEVGADIEAGMAKTLVSPSVQVIPKVKAGQYYVLLGKVYRPGVFPLDTSINLRQAIGNSGGISTGSFGMTTGSIANLGDSFVIRDGKRLDINFAAMIYQGDDSQNIYLRPGDYVYIASALNQEIYIMGSVASRIAPYKDGLTLVQLMSTSYGAYNDDPYIQGNWHDVMIIRGRLCCPCVIRVDFPNILEGCAKDVYLQPGDLVYVPAKTARFGRALIKLAIDSFISSFIGNIATYEANRLLRRNGL